MDQGEGQRQHLGVRDDWADGSPFNWRVQLEEPFHFVTHALERSSQHPCFNPDLSLASNAIDLSKPNGIFVGAGELPNVVVLVA